MEKHSAYHARRAPPPAAGSAEQIADYLNIGRTSVFALIKSGKLPAVRLGRRTLIRYADADALLVSCSCTDVFA